MKEILKCQHTAASPGWISAVLLHYRCAFTYERAAQNLWTAPHHCPSLGGNTPSAMEILWLSGFQLKKLPQSLKHTLKGKKTKKPSGA